MIGIDEIIVCPKCRRKLERKEAKYLCSFCDFTYEIKDGIPILLDENLSDLEKAEAKTHSEIADDYFDMAQLDTLRNIYYHSRFRHPLTQLPKGSLILEVGCGTGEDGMELIKAGLRVVETDIAFAVLSKARRNIEFANLHSQSTFLAASGNRLPFMTGAFDGALVVATLHHAEDPKRFLSEISRCVRPGGLVVIGMEPNSWFYYTLNPIKKIIQKILKTRSKSIADATTKGFSRRRLVNLVKNKKLSVKELVPVWYLNGYLHLGLESLYRILRLKKRVNVHPGLEKLLITIDETLGKIPILKLFPWHWNLILVKEKQKMHIAINALALSDEIAGGGRYISGLIRWVGLLGEDFRFTIFLKPSSGLDLENSRANVRMVYCGWLAKFRPLRILWEHTILPIHIIFRKIDLLHSPGFVSPLWIWGSCRSVVTIFDMTFFLLPRYHNFWKRLYFTKLIPPTIRRASKIITISHSSKQDIIRHFHLPENKVAVTYLGVDGSSYESEESARGKIREMCGVAERFILFVGVLEPRKNLPRLLEAYYKLRENEGLQHKLVVVGKKGWGYDEVFRKVEDLDLEEEVIFTGYVPEESLLSFYKAADLFVYPSLYEGLGIPVMEAMACATPVVTSSVSAMPEVVGDAAIKVDPYDVDGLAEAMGKVLHDSQLRERLIQTGLERVRLFSWEKMARETLAVYSEVLGDI